MAYDNIKSHKKHGFTLSLENTFLEKAQGSQIAPNLLGLKPLGFLIHVCSCCQWLSYFYVGAYRDNFPDWNWFFIVTVTFAIVIISSFH